MIDSAKTGEFIRQARVKKGLSQRELASRLNITRESVSKWENGHHLPDVSIMELLARELDVSVNEIINGSYQESAPVEPVKEVKKPVIWKVIAVIAALALIVLFTRRYYLSWNEGAMSLVTEKVINYSDKTVTGMLYLLEYDEDVRFASLTTDVIEVSDEKGNTVRILAVSCYSSLGDIISGSHDSSGSKILDYQKPLQQYDYLVYYSGDLSKLKKAATLEELMKIIDVNTASHWQNAGGE